jgi:hypothetical protein
MLSKFTLTPSDVRHAARFRVKIRGTDCDGNFFKQDAFTHDISHRGLRLEGAPCTIERWTILEIQHNGRRAKYRVVWTGLWGTEQHAHAGLQILDPGKHIWGSPLPGKPIYSQPPGR